MVRAIRNFFERFAERGSMRRVCLRFRDEGLLFAIRRRNGAEVRRIPPSYSSIVQVLGNSVYVRHLPRAEWRLRLSGHHRGYIDWETFSRPTGRTSEPTAGRARTLPGEACERDSPYYRNSRSAVTASGRCALTTSDASPLPAATLPARTLWKGGAPPTACGSAGGRSTKP